MWGSGNLLKLMVMARSSTMKACVTRGHGKMTSNTARGNSSGKTAQYFEANSSTATKSTANSNGPTPPHTSANLTKTVSKVEVNSPMTTTATTMVNGKTT